MGLLSRVRAFIRDGQRSERSKATNELEDDVPQSLDVVFDLTRDQLQFQMDQIDALDTKAGFILASASLITGALAIWHPSGHGTGYGCFSAAIFNALPKAAVVVYGFSILSFAFASWVGQFEYPTSPDKLRELYLRQPPTDTKRTMRANMEGAYLRNVKRINRKVFFLMVGLVSLFIEGVLVAVILITMTGS